MLWKAVQFSIILSHQILLHISSIPIGKQWLCGRPITFQVHIQISCLYKIINIILSNLLILGYWSTLFQIGESIFISIISSQGSDLAGFTALHYASWYSRERIAQNLLSFDIDPNQSGTVNDRPLHFGE